MKATIEVVETLIDMNYNKEMTAVMTRDEVLVKIGSEWYSLRPTEENYKRALNAIAEADRVKDI